MDVKLNRRGRKVIDYAALGNYSEDSDDDFVNTKKQARVPSPAKPPRLPRVSKLKLPVTAKPPIEPSSNDRKVEKENNNLTKLKTPPDANKTPTKVSPIKESLHNATNQITPRQKTPLRSESVSNNLVTQIPKGSKPIDDIDSFYGPEPDLVGHSLLSQDTDIISSCECASSSQESDDFGSLAIAAGEASTFMLGPSPVKVTPKKTIVISSDSDSDFDGRPTRKPPVKGIVRPKRRKIDDDDSDDDIFIGVEKKRSKTTEKKQEERKMPPLAAKKTRSPEQMTKKNNQQKEPVKTPPAKLKLAKTKESNSEEEDDPEEEEKIYPKVTQLNVVDTVPIVTPEEVEPPKPKKLKVDDDLKKKIEVKAKKEDNSKMKPPAGRVAAGLFRKVVPKVTTPVVETPVAVAKPVIITVPKPVVKPKQPAWNPPGRSNGVSTPKIAVNSPVIGLRLGISRNNRRCTPLHPDVKIKT